MYERADVIALCELQAHHNAHLVLCSRNKIPVRRGWNLTQPSWRVVENWLQRDGLVGMMPWSIGCTVADVDAGDAGELLELHPPLVTLETKRVGGRHLYWLDSKGRNNQKWNWNGLSGDIRSAYGFVVLWENESPTRLLHALQQSRPDAVKFPWETLLGAKKEEVLL